MFQVCYIIIIIIILYLILVSNFLLILSSAHNTWLFFIKNNNNIKKKKKKKRFSIRFFTGLNIYNKISLKCMFHTRKPPWFFILLSTHCRLYQSVPSYINIYIGTFNQHISIFIYPSLSFGHPDRLFFYEHILYLDKFNEHINLNKGKSKILVIKKKPSNIP